ncbi:MAG: 4-hydroxyphenylacetate 3-hydroxylase N-terminal domain-containing protein [Spongiibacteraceae bacterium]|jgi:aromatic ring hydroxylase|nr:4-hydroxyphenylacetate 3-hydroxylase N-terminal domain-containing protein [Spongiibacteraceae bacterium]
MAARTGEQYKAGLKDGRCIWLGNKEVDILEDPRLAGSIEGMAGYFDWQHRFAEDCLTENPETGELMTASLIQPRNREDLERRGRCFDRLARYSYGMLGRTPDYVNITLAGFVMRSDIYHAYGHGDWAENLKRFWSEVAERDLSLTHTIIQPAIDKSIGDLAGINGEIALRVVKRNKDSVIVRGAKILATLGPFADELYVYPASPILGGASPDHAISFSVPVGTKGLITVCRDHYGVDADLRDKPFSSRFDEQDAFVIFDDVEVPIERVFIDGDVDFYNKTLTHGWYGNVTHQTATRAAVKLEFAYDLCTQMARITNAEKRPEVTVMLGEIWSYAALTRGAIRAGIDNARDYGNGAWFLDERPMRAIAAMMPQWMVRVNDIIKTLGSHNLLATPSLSAFENPEMADMLRRYMPAATGDYTAEQRSQIFRTAWDFVGSALGGRTELYERFYLASQPRNLMMAHMNAQQTEQWTQVQDFLRESGIS